MKIMLTGNTLTVMREPGDTRQPTESAFFHALKKELNASGHDLVKKVMSKDGHMVGGNEYPYYLRDRKRRYAFVDWQYALRLIHGAYNAGELITLTKEVF